MQSQKPPGYLPQLDGLRAFAVSFVIIFHWVPQTALINQLPNGSIGVTLFFVLSGFLITQILIQNRNQILDGRTTLSEVYKNFVIRRALRIFPVYYLFITFIYLVLPQASDISKFPAYYYLYGYNILLHQTGNWADILSPFWTLSVEEQFYLIWPTVVLVTPSRYLYRVIVFTILLGITSRVGWWLAGDRQGVLTLTCLDAFGCGALWAYMLVEQPEEIPQFLNRLRWATGFAFIAFVYIVLHSPYADYVKIFQRTILAVLSLYLIANATFGFRGVTGQILGNPVLIYIGKISYGIYVYHMIVPDFATSYLMQGINNRLHIPVEGPLMHGLLSLVILILLASLSWFILERPINNLKRYFTYAKSPA